MKISKKYYGLALGAMALGMLASCSNDLSNEPGPVIPSQGNGSLLVRNPEINAWSGKTNFTTRAGESVVAPEALSDNEISSVKAFFDAPNNTGAFLEIEDLSAWKNYYVQNVSTTNPITNNSVHPWEYMGDNNDKIVNLKVWSLSPSQVLNLLDKEDYLTSDAKADIDDTLAEPQLVLGTQIKDFSFEGEGYVIQGVGNTWEKTPYNNVVSSGDKKVSIWNIPYKIARLNGEEDVVYVAFYSYNPFYGDNGYWNRIVKLTKVELPESSIADGDDEEGEVVASSKYGHNNEVEVNLSVADTHEQYNVEDLITKLSLHVRYAHDVRVRIPVPTELLVPADDLAIVLSHQQTLASYGTENHATFEIAGHPIDLFVNFEEEALDCAGNGIGGYYITITTQGINDEVMNYCFNNYGDGINFEIFNYYQWNVVDANGNATRTKPTESDIDALQWDWLNKTTVEFGYGDWNAFTNYTDYPYYFINEKNNLRDSGSPDMLNLKDCLVKIIDHQAGAYDNYYEGAHLNGSSWNDIYVRNDIFGTSKHDDKHSQTDIWTSVN